MNDRMEHEKIKKKEESLFCSGKLGKGNVRTKTNEGEHGTFFCNRV